MNLSLAQILAASSRHPGQILRRGVEDTTHLIYVDEWQRYAALKIYRREFFADAHVVRQFLARVEQVQGLFASGIAYPFLGGHENGRLFLLLQQLPGHHLSDLLRHRGPLDLPTLLALGGLIAHRLEFVHRHYGLAPSLHPGDVWFHRDGPQDWTVSFSDYDLRPVRQPWAVPWEIQAIQDLSLLLHGLHTGAFASSFEDLLRLAPGGRAESLPPFFRRLLGPEEDRPQSLPELRRMFEEEAPPSLPDPGLSEPAVSPALLPWVPPLSALTDRFAYGPPLASLDFPASFEASDLLTDRPCRVHILPPAGEDAPRLRALVQQGVKLAHRPRTAPFSPVTAVLADPSCCLIAEDPPDGLSLWELLQRRGSFRLAEACAVLRHLAAAVEQVRQADLLLPVLEPQNILLRPGPAAAPASWAEDLTQPGAFQLSLRPFPTNVLFTEAPGLEEIQGRGPARARATRNYFHPDYALAALAHRLLRCALPPAAVMPAPLAVLFHQAFSQPASTLPFSQLVLRLERAAKSLPHPLSTGQDSWQAAPARGTAGSPSLSCARFRPVLSTFPATHSA